MLISVSQCLQLQSTLTEFHFELTLLLYLSCTILAVSVLKVLYYHLSNTNHVRKIKHLLETRRPSWRSGEVTTAAPVSPLPKIERVSGCLSLRKRSSGQASSLKITEAQQSPHSPPARDCTKSSTSERTESPRRRKNQILAAQMLL